MQVRCILILNDATAGVHRFGGFLLQNIGVAFYEKINKKYIERWTLLISS